MGRIIAVDVGDRRIGVAMSDLLGITAQPVETYWRKNRAADIEHFVKLLAEREADVIVCGLPLNMNGSEGSQAADTREFANALSAASGITVEFADERLTTAMARRSLIEGGMRRDKRKNVVDQVAAVHILQTYMDKTTNINKGGI